MIKKIKMAFFDFSRTVAKDTGFGAGPALLGRKNDYDKIYSKFKAKKIDEEKFVKEVAKLWMGLKEKDLPKLHSRIKLNPNIKSTLRNLQKMKIKNALVSYIPTKLAQLYANLGFDYLSGTEFEMKDRVFTGKTIKINSDKSKAILDICKMEKIIPKEAIAVGDSINDVNMFKTVGFENSFAYNASSEVAKNAKYPIRNFNEIIPIIKEFK